MAPLLKYALSALCVFAISPILAAPVQSSVALERRQGAGVGVASDAIFTDTDSGSGYAIEDAEDNTANTISGSKGAAAPPPGPGSRRRRQLNKISNGEAALANSVGEGTVGNQVAGEGNDIDGQTTNDIGTVGTQAGSDEETGLEDAGSDVP